MDACVGDRQALAQRAGNAGKTFADLTLLTHEQAAGAGETDVVETDIVKNIVREKRIDARYIRL
ncbi:hypothetical protein [Serratia sp. M24T3]|uniref:hypothetical protein n=1 Tax=Serratia sp. M24T3 TaxID=932213 RepID=UPI00025BAF2B|nr:hypothetical protein [Serratia sp. M24T3]EIC85695.1 hypothetical protein SPM24T3_05131 [Serratia sp. M24T3]